MEVRIGVLDSPKELEVALDENADRAALKKQVDQAIAGEDSVLWLTDRRGREIGVPSSKLAWVEIGGPSDDRRVGFGAP